MSIRANPCLGQFGPSNLDGRKVFRPYGLRPTAFGLSEEVLCYFSFLHNIQAPRNVFL